MTAQKRVKDNQLIRIIIIAVAGFLGPPWEENIKLAFQVGTAFLSTCSHLTKWIFVRRWLALNPQQRLSFACSIQGPSLKETLGDMRKKDGMLRGWWQRYQKIFSRNRPALNNPLIIWHFSVGHWTSDCHEMQSGPHQHWMSKGKRRGEAGGSVRGLRWMPGQTPHCGKPERIICGGR